MGEKKEKKEKKKRKKIKKEQENGLKSKAKSIILSWCHKSLKPLFKEKKITREEYKSIANKSVKKIIKSHDVWTKKNIKNLQTTSKHKVMEVINAYIKKYSRSC